jgi:hypothetical protein
MKKLLSVKLNLLLLLATILIASVSCGNTSRSTSTTSASHPKVQITSLVTQKQFDELFPLRDKFYSYAAFVKAAKELGNIKIKVSRRAVSVYQIIRTDKTTGKSTIVRQDPDWNENWAKQKPDSTYEIDYGNFCSEKDLQTDKRELAAFFAHIAHETRHGENEKYNDGLMLIHENNTSLSYTGGSDEYLPVAGKKYYGRGPMQISYNGNYGYASDCIFGNHLLLNNPDLVENDPVIAFKTAIYFWMTPQTHKPSAHDVMIGKWQPKPEDKAKGRVPGFGMTINIVNGAVECNQGDKVYNMNDRIGFYKYFLQKLGASDPNCVCSCGSMAPVI